MIMRLESAMQKQVPRWSLRMMMGVGAVLISCVLLYSTVLSPDSEKAVETFNFEDTQEEQRCFLGAGTSVVAAPGSSPIPNVVHFIWGIKDPDISFIHYLVIRSALLSIRPDEVKIHYVSINEDNTWFQKLKGSVTFISHNLESELSGQIGSVRQAAHLADLLRLDILNREGGIYLDMDVISLQPFDNLRTNTFGVVLGHEGGDRHGLCNAIILARRDSRFVKRWIASYDTFSRNEWNYHSVILPQQLALQNPQEVCRLSPTVFFWPTWTKNHVQYMHEPLSRSEALHAGQVLAQHGGSFYENQLAYHAWSQMTWARYLKDLTPQAVRTKDTRFNIMLRRFLDEDSCDDPSANC